MASLACGERFWAWNNNSEAHRPPEAWGSDRSPSWRRSTGRSSTPQRHLLKQEATRLQKKKQQPITVAAMVMINESPDRFLSISISIRRRPKWKIIPKNSSAVALRIFITCSSMSLRWNRRVTTHLQTPGYHAPAAPGNRTSGRWPAGYSSCRTLILDCSKQEEEEKRRRGQHIIQSVRFQSATLHQESKKTTYFMF